MIEFNLPAMTCGHCVGTVTQVVHQVDPAATVQIALDKKRLSVASSLEGQAFAAALAAAGYPPA